MRVLVDTCVWAHFLRRNRAKDDSLCVEMERLIRADVVQMVGPVRQEILSGVQPVDRFSQLKEYLRYYPNLPLDEEDDENAANYYNVCRRNGLQGAATDFLLCAASVRYGLSLFTIDHDFDRYALYLPIKRHMPRGRK